MISMADETTIYNMSGNNKENLNPEEYQSLEDRYDEQKLSHDHQASRPNKLVKLKTFQQK